jgi:hypothetical protein
MSHIMQVDLGKFERNDVYNVFFGNLSHYSHSRVASRVATCSNDMDAMWSRVSRVSSDLRSPSDTTISIDQFSYRCRELPRGQEVFFFYLIWLWINTYENTINIEGWTSINPSYFDVNYRGTRFWPTAIYLILAMACYGSIRRGHGHSWTIMDSQLIIFMMVLNMSPIMGQWWYSLWFIIWSIMSQIMIFI